MAEANNVFISWSGPRSKSAAEALKEWLPLVVPTANPWMSATDIDKGTRWREEVAAALDTMKAGIICLTPDNLTAEWLLFEAGALSKTHDPKTRVWTYLLGDLKPHHVRDPLAIFQATTTEKEDTRKLVLSINKNLTGTMPESTVNHWFDKSWPDLKEKLDAIPTPSGVALPKRPPEEMAGDTLQLLRHIARRIEDIDNRTTIAQREIMAAHAARRAEELRIGLATGKLLPTSNPDEYVDTTAYDPLPVPASGTEPKPTPPTPRKGGVRKPVAPVRKPKP